MEIQSSLTLSMLKSSKNLNILGVLSQQGDTKKNHSLSSTATHKWKISELKTDQKEVFGHDQKGVKKDSPGTQEIRGLIDYAIILKKKHMSEDRGIQPFTNDKSCKLSKCLSDPNVLKKYFSKKKVLKNLDKKDKKSSVLYAYASSSKNSKSITKNHKTTIKKRSKKQQILPKALNTHFSTIQTHENESKLFDNQNCSVNNIIYEDRKRKLKHPTHNSQEIYNPSIFFPEANRVSSILTNSTKSKVKVEKPKKKVTIIESLPETVKNTSRFYKKDKAKTLIPQIPNSNIVINSDLEFGTPDNLSEISNHGWINIEAVENHGKTSEFVKKFEKNFVNTFESFKKKYLGDIECKKNNSDSKEKSDEENGKNTKINKKYTQKDDKDKEIQKLNLENVAGYEDEDNEEL
ncbi:hypothetical protein SteCoe_35626 [Stentor coeruleus]|uniref:Uncharacterized protein n=1 Tax=Stentor coeruleus TaxID=5963 RepID=A0A1R2ARW4_9CILI|nr:hypothetical protein SteCoe_35626 [Stentor coeruleus]